MMIKLQNSEKHHTVYGEMLKPLLIALILMLLSFSQLFSQSDCCENCPYSIQDGNPNTELNINIANAVNDDLAGSQGVCGVSISFMHQWLGDLEMTLVSPSGQEVQLIGNLCNGSANCGCTDGSTYNISFVPCGSNASPDNHECIACNTQGSPDPGGASIGPPSAVWQNPDLSCSNTDYTGSYYPNDGCLEDFNTGAINGQWTLIVGDYLAQDFGEILDFELTFCDEEGIICNDNDCFAMATITQHDFPFCQGNIIMLDGTASTEGSYFWTGSGIVSGQGTNSIMIDEAGIYSLTVTTNDGCDHTATHMVTLAGLAPNLTAQVIGMVGCGQTATLDASNSTGNNLTCQWFKDSNQNVPAGEFGSQIIAVDEAGTYYLFCYTEDFCTDQLSIEVESTLGTSASVTGVLDCDTPTVGIVASSNDNNASYEWSGPGGFIYPNAFNNVMIPGVYTVTITSTTGCTDMASVVVHEDYTPPTVEIATPESINCTNGVILLDATDSDNGTDYTYQWSGNNILAGETTLIATVDAAGTYNLTITAPNGCSSTQSVNVDEDITTPVAIITSDAETLTCGIGAITLDATSSDVGPNITYEWSDDLGATPMVTVTTAGVYTITVTNEENTCSQVESILISEDINSPIAVAEADNNGILCADDEIVIDAGNSQGGWPLTYEWSDNLGTTPMVSVTAAGTYTVTVTDAINACTDIATATIDAAVPLDVVLESEPATNGNNGSITASVTGGEEPYFYQWSNSEITPTITGLSPGTYELTITDANGCEFISSIVVGMASSLETPDFVEQFEVYPNPNNGQFQVLLELDAAREGDLLLYNMLGEQVYAKKYNQKIIKETISVTTISVGTYMLLWRDSKHVVLEKVILY